MAAARSPAATPPPPGGLTPLGSTPLTYPYFGDYELREEIGRGGMGVVYKGRQVSLNRWVAIKVLLHGPFTGDEDVQRFCAEAEVVARLRHPNIVAIYEMGVQDGHHFFSMEYIQGMSLAQKAHHQPLPAAQAARYVQIAAEAVHYAHQQGVAHRDLKPANVLVDEADQPRITDFGLAKRLDGEGVVTMTLTGQVLGTPGYLAPEQAAGKKDAVGAASDIYALGAILYHLLIGRPPFQSETLTDLLSQVVNRDPIAPHRLDPRVAPDLETICLQCLRKEPSERYASAQELADDLKRWQSGKPIKARSDNRVNQLRRAYRRRPWPCGAATALALGLLGGAAIAGFHRIQLWRLENQPELFYLLINQEVYLTDAQGAHEQKLSLTALSLEVSPDGKRLAYSAEEGDVCALYLSHLDGSGPRRIMDNITDFRWLDDHTIIYEPPNIQGVWSLDLRTRKKQQLFDWRQVRKDGYAGGLALSPDRTRLVCNPQNGVRAFTQNIYLCDLHGEHVQVVWADADDRIADACPLWLPGDQIIWDRTAAPEGDPRSWETAMVTCRLGETNWHALTDWSGRKIRAGAAPDGSRIFFTKQVFLTNGPPDTWLEDSDKHSPKELWIMNADGTGQRKFLDRTFPARCDLAVHWYRRGPAPTQP